MTRREAVRLATALVRLWRQERAFTLTVPGLKPRLTQAEVALYVDGRGPFLVDDAGSRVWLCDVEGVALELCEEVAV